MYSCAEKGQYFFKVNGFYAHEVSSSSSRNIFGEKQSGGNHLTNPLPPTLTDFPTPLLWSFFFPKMTRMDDLMMPQPFGGRISLFAWEKSLWSDGKQ